MIDRIAPRWGTLTACAALGREFERHLSLNLVDTSVDAARRSASATFVWASLFIRSENLPELDEQG